MLRLGPTRAAALRFATRATTRGPARRATRTPVHAMSSSEEEATAKPPLVASKRPKDHRKCVGVVLLNARDEAFVARRADMRKDAGDDGVTSGNSPWQMPQGGIDKDEDHEAAARRELFEETGVRSVEFIAQIPAWLCYQFPPAVLAEWARRPPPHPLQPMRKGKGWGGKYVGQAQHWYFFRFTGSEAEIDLNAHGAHKAEFDEWKWAPLGAIAAEVVDFKRPVYEKVVEYARNKLDIGVGPKAAPK